MKFTLEQAGGVQRITAWSESGLTVGETLFTGAVLVAADRAIDLPIADLAGLDGATVEQALDGVPELLLLGTGNRQRFPAPALMKAVTARGIGIEVMDTLAAARTYNVLVGEGRRVVALLLPLTA